MSSSPSRFIFAAFCAVGFIVIAFGAWWEIARLGRGAPDKNAVALLKLRLFSAALWLFIFGLNFYAVMWLWPHAAPHTPELKSEARRFLLVVASGFFLLIPAFALLTLDLLRTSRERRLQAAQRQHQMALLLSEAANAQQGKSSTRNEAES